MSMAAKRSRITDAPSEPDQLEGFSSPREVDRLYGHEAALREFSDALSSGRLHHAWLIVGPEGVGKATLAYRFARMVLAGPDNDKGDPNDPQQPLFRKVAGLAHPNLLLLRRPWIEKAKRYSQVISVDEVRRLRSFLGTTPGEGSWRVVIVDRADELNQSAANALLKALEEPPPRTLFLLISAAEGRLPVTIRSRVRALRVSGLAEKDVAAAVSAALDRDEHKASAKTLASALDLCQGSVRRALELVSGEGIELYDEILTSLATLPELDGPRLHRNAERLAAMTEPARLDLYLSLLLGLIERLIHFTATGEGATQAERTVAKQLLCPGNLPAWAEAWEDISEARTETFALNLDRNLLVLNTWFRLQALAREHPV
jgi:DNA polymerase III subunit delta'